MIPQTPGITTPEGSFEACITDAAMERLGQTPEIRVLALDDDDTWCQRIRMALAANDVACDVVKDLSQFTKALRNVEYDVASTDSMIERTGEDGVEAQSTLWNEYPAIGKVVYSVHVGDPVFDQEARHLGADRVVEKHVFGSDDTFVQAVLEAARLGLFRRVLARLKVAKSAHPGFREEWPSEVSDEQERLVYTEALKALMTSFLRGEEDRELMKLLKKRGILRDFDSPNYIKLPFRKKLAELLAYVQVTPAQLSQILEIDTGSAKELLAGDEALSFSDAARENIYRLASILDFVLRLSDGEPDLMPGIWTVKNLYANSENVPPWDADGFRNYLIEQQAAGLEQAVGWIRSYSG